MLNVNGGNGHGPSLPEPLPVDSFVPGLRATDVPGTAVRREDLDVIARVSHSPIVIPADQKAGMIEALRAQVMGKLFLEFGQRCLEHKADTRLIPFLFELQEVGLLLHIRIAVWEFKPTTPEQLLGQWAPPAKTDTPAGPMGQGEPS